MGIEDEILSHTGISLIPSTETAKDLSLNAKTINIHSSDIFYRKDPNTPEIATKYNCPAVEMETFGLLLPMLSI